MPKESMPRCSRNPEEAYRRLRMYLNMCGLLDLNSIVSGTSEWYWVRYVALGIAMCLEDLENALGVAFNNVYLEALKSIAKKIDVGLYSSIEDRELVELLTKVCAELRQLSITTRDRSV